MKKFLAAFLLLLTLSCAAGAIITETSFAELGYANFEMQDANTERCTEIAFAKTPDLNAAVYSIISLHATFAPVQGKDARIKVYLNDDTNAGAALAPAAFINNWARIELPREGINELNRLKICAKTTNMTTGITVLNDSTIGSYFKPDFSKAGAFTITAAGQLKTGQKFGVVVTVENYGSEDANVSIAYRKASLESEMPQLKIVGGTTTLNTIIPKCMERDAETSCIVPGKAYFKYEVKVAEAMQMTLLPAILSYKNIFGEQITMESNRPTIRVSETEVKLKPYLLANKDSLMQGEKGGLKLIIHNIGADAVYNIDAVIKAGHNFALEGKSHNLIEVIGPNETAEFDFNIIGVTDGPGQIGCSLSYLDYNLVETDCNSAMIKVRSVEIDPAIIGGAVLLLLAILAYAYFALKK